MVNWRNHNNNFGVIRRNLFSNGDQFEWMYQHSKSNSDGESVTHSSHHTRRPNGFLPGRFCESYCIGRNKLYMVNKCYNSDDFGVNHW